MFNFVEFSFTEELLRNLYILSLPIDRNSVSRDEVLVDVFYHNLPSFSDQSRRYC